MSMDTSRKISLYVGAIGQSPTSYLEPCILSLENEVLHVICEGLYMPKTGHTYSREELEELGSFFEEKRKPFGVIFS